MAELVEAPFVVWYRTDGAALMYAKKPPGYGYAGEPPSPSAPPLQWTLVEQTPDGGISTMPRLQGPSGDDWIALEDVGIGAPAQPAP